MSSNLIPSDPSSGPLSNYSAAGAARGWDAPRQPEGAFNVAEQLSRVWSAVRRYKWLILAIVAVGSSAGYALTRLVAPKYDVNATIWIAKGMGANGPISTPGLISNDLAWPDLARSYIVLDQVVARLALYVTPEQAGDRATLAGLRPSENLQPGRYALSIDQGGQRYELSRVLEGRGARDSLVERGAVGDSIGLSVGFVWKPEAELLGRGRRIAFEVMTPREAAVRLSRSLSTGLPPNSNMMRMGLSGPNPQVLAQTLNTIQEVFVQEAARLKRENLSVVARTVEEQLDSAKRQVERTRSALETFRVRTITLPTESSPVAPGVTATSNPVFTAFFQDNVNYKVVQRDREALERILAQREARGGRISIEALRALGSVIVANPGLSTELTNLAAAQTQLRQWQQTYTDSYPPVRALREKIETLESGTIPELARASLAQLRSQEQDMERRIAGQAEEMRQIPQRTIQEAGLTLEAGIADRIYTDLQTRAAAARLAELSAIPDVAVLDPAVAPLRPTSDTAASIFVMAIMASIGAAIVLAVLLDRIDKRFRYPEQATSELGLDIMGAIPTITHPRNSSARLQEASQLVESFRSLSLSVRSAFDGSGPVQLTISSPGPGDGKSFISANLASALADGGYRTVLVDGDIRRGALHSVFAPMEQSPGLVDYLAGEATLGEVIRPTQHSNLCVVPGGKRRRHGPELLAGNAMTTMVRELRMQFDAIVVDSAPLGAGIDPFALGVATGAMLIVLRTGETDRKLAQAKLEVLDRMPVRILGTVLNDIGENPQFKYYYYLEGYGALEAAHGESALIGSGNGAHGSR
jgi:capsular exopolysaccharide synthesis family protein